ncbi:hypothetical protein LCGC14_0569490 [marine sediment metagenome]|uniref:Uncharacterized protein n=1 Tax=marine sediment metagenome TaxID=412755 RepID=A0A0F9RJM8_9ZZZZ
MISLKKSLSGQLKGHNVQAKMTFYTTRHFIEQSPVPIDRIEQMLNAAWVLTSRMPTSADGSLLKAADEIGRRIYAYCQGKKKYIIVIGKDRDTDKFNTLITMYRLDHQGAWAIKKFRKTPVKKRRLLRTYLKFTTAVVTTRQVEKAPQQSRPQPRKRVHPQSRPVAYEPRKNNILTVRELGIDIEPIKRRR